ncbi:MAG TPA: NUDIX hydrolase [Micromonosporaceae bacterium]|nr:NUDIX hydrolase [Micromonosporaceae bacterium]
MSQSTFIPPEIWYAQLPTVYAAAGALITDPAGRVLMVKPNYRDYWMIPGGTLEADEPPHAGCAREVTEEIGLIRPVGRLLVMDWTPRAGQRPRPVVYFLFDGGVLDDSAPIRLPADEIDDYAFVDPAEAPGRLAPNVAHRLPAALSARVNGSTIYLPGAGSINNV